MSQQLSNASVERVFSLLKLIKTNLRNALKRETLVGHMHANDVHVHQVKLTADFVREINPLKAMQLTVRPLNLLARVSTVKHNLV